MERWPGLGPKRLRNGALAVIEDALAAASLAVDATATLVEVLPILMALLRILRDLRPGQPLDDATVHELRRVMLQKAMEEERDGN